MLKLTGILVFSVCISLMGFYMSSRSESSTRLRREFIELIYSIRNGIQYGKLSLEEIYRSFPAHELKKCGFYDSLTNSYQPDLKKTLEKSGIKLSKAETELLLSFAAECGKSTFAEEEIKTCERYITLLEQLDKDMSEKENTRRLIYGKLGILAGILSCILLL